MPNPWSDIDTLLFQHKADWARVEEAMKEAKATSLKVLETGIWKCRFRPYKAEQPMDVRGRSASELVEKLGTLAKERAAAREAAKAALEARRQAHKADIQRTRGEVKQLGGTRFKVRALSGGSHRWTCRLRDRSPKHRFDVEFDQPSADRLIAEVQAFVTRVRP